MKTETTTARFAVLVAIGAVVLVGYDLRPRTSPPPTRPVGVILNGTYHSDAETVDANGGIALPPEVSVSGGECVENVDINKKLPTPAAWTGCRIGEMRILPDGRVYICQPIVR